MKKLTLLLAVVSSGLALTVFQNCNNGSETGASPVLTESSVSTTTPTTSTTTTTTTTPVTTTTTPATTAGSGDAAYQALLTQIFSSLPIASYLTDLGISSASYAAILPGALANSTATAASIEAASQTILADLKSHSYVFQALTNSEKATLLADVNAALTEIRTVNSGTLNPVNQVSQEQVILVLETFASYL